MCRSNQNRQAIANEFALMGGDKPEFKGYVPNREGAKELAGFGAETLVYVPHAVRRYTGGFWFASVQQALRLGATYGEWDNEGEGETVCAKWPEHYFTAPQGAWVNAARLP